jgi:hypothetical protein
VELNVQYDHQQLEMYFHSLPDFYVKPDIAAFLCDAATELRFSLICFSLIDLNNDFFLKFSAFDC